MDRSLKGASPASKEHTENMEHMAGEMVNSIGTAIFNKECIQCFRGIDSTNNFIFCNEEELKAFMPLSDEREQEGRTPYQPHSNKIMS